MIGLVTRGMGQGSLSSTKIGLCTRGMGYVSYIPDVTRTKYIDRGSSSATPPKVIFKEHQFPVILLKKIYDKDETDLIDVRIVSIQSDIL